MAIGGPVAVMAAVNATAAKALNRLVVDAVLKIQALIQYLDRALPHRGTQFNRWGIAISGTVAIVVANVYWFGGRASEASQYVQMPVELGVALTGPDAVQWLALMRMNDIGRAQRDCQPVPQPADGKAYNFTLWTQLPPVASH